MKQTPCVENPSRQRKANVLKYYGIHHLAMATSDMDGTIRFWRDLLGMRLVAGLGKPGARQYFFEISATSLLAFFEWKTVEPIPEKDHGYPARGPRVFDHVSFEVESDEDLWTLKERLDAAGFWVSEIIDHGFIHSLYSFDPNGIAIEFSSSLEKVDLREHPMMLDADPTQVTREGPEPQPARSPFVEDRTPPDERRIYPGEGLEFVQGVKRNWFNQPGKR